MDRGPKSSWLCKIVKSIHTPADVLKLQRYLNKCSNVVPVIEEDTIDQFDRIIRNVFNQFESNDENHSYLMVILNSINFLCQKNCFADWISPNHERQPEFCTKFAVLMKFALKYIATYINVGEKNFLTLLSVFKEIILKSSEHIYLKNVFVRALSYLILKLIISGKVEFHLKKILLDLMVNLLEQTDRQTRSDTFHKVKSLLCMMLKSLHKYGDYRIQMSAVEIIIRFTTLVPNERVDIAKCIQSEEICQCFAKFSPRNFEMECRIILNLLNQIHGQNSNVFTIACEKAFVGDYSIKKPKHEDYKELWVDFNLNSQSITICCDGDSLMCVEENQMPEHSGFWEILTITSKNVRKLSIVPSGGSFSGKDDVTVMHLKLASPCDYIHATSAAAISRCREICFHFKQSAEFKDLEDRILPQIFRGRHQERKGSVTPDITLNVCQMLEQKTRGKSRQLPKNDHESNEASLRNNKNNESCKFSSYSEEKNVIGAAEKLGDDPEKQLETLQADLLKEIMQESQILGGKHTQETNSVDASLKELYNKLAAHKFVKYSAVAPCAKMPDLSQIHEALSNGKQNITETSTQKIFSNSVAIPAVPDTVTVNEQCAAEYVVNNNTTSKENKGMDDNQKKKLQKESKFCLESSGGLVAAPSGNQSITETSTHKTFSSNSDSIAVVQKPVNLNEDNASEYVVNNIYSKENQRMDDKQKNLLQKESKFCLESSGGLVAAGSVQVSNSKDCAGDVFLQEVKSQMYKKPESYQPDCVTMPLNSNNDTNKSPDVPINAKGSGNGLSAILNIASEQKEFILDNVSLNSSDVKSNPILSDTLIQSTCSISHEDKLKHMSTEQKIVEINSTQEMTRDSGKTDSINSTITKKSNKQLKQTSKNVGNSLKKGKLSISLQKSTNDKIFENNRSENETQSKPDLFLKNDVAEVTNSVEKAQETTLISCYSEIQGNKNNSDEKYSENRECEGIRNTATVRCKDVLVQDILPENIQAVHEEPMEQPCKNLQPIIFKTHICEAAVPPALTKYSTKEKRKTNNDCLQLKTTSPDEKLLDKSQIATSPDEKLFDKSQIATRDVVEKQGESARYTPKLSQEGILATKDKCPSGVGQDKQTNDLSLSSSNSSPLFQPFKRDSHVHLGRTIERKYFNTDKNSKSVDSKVTYEKFCKKSNGKTAQRTSGRRRLFSSEAGIEIINVQFSSKKYEQKQEKKLSRTVSAKKVNIATTKVVQHGVICKKGFDSKNLKKNKENLEISESDSSWNKIFPSNNKTKSNSKNNDKKKASRYKKITADNSDNHNLNRERNNKVVSELSDLDASWRNIFPTNPKKKCKYNSGTEVKISKQHKQTINLNNERAKPKDNTASAIDSQINSLHNMTCAQWSCLPNQLLDMERMRGDSFGDEGNVISSKDAVKQASEMFFDKQENTSLFEEFPSLIVENEKKLYTEPYRYFDDTEIKDPFGEIRPTTNILNGCSTRTKPTVIKNGDKELDNVFGNNSDVSFEGKDITSKKRVDILHSSDESENHDRNQPLLRRLWEENCNKIHCNRYKIRGSNDQALKNNESQSLIKGNISLSVEIPEHESSSKVGTSCITHNLNTKSSDNQSNKNYREKKPSYSSNVVVATTCKPSEGTLITSTRNYNPAQNIGENSRSVKRSVICEVKKPEVGTNTVNNANTHVNHSQNVDNRKLFLPSTGVNSRTTSTPCSVPGSLCFSSKTGISPIGSVKNIISRKNVDNLNVENCFNKLTVADIYQLKHGLGANNMKDSGCKLSSVKRNVMSDDIDKKSFKKIESDTKKETSITLDSTDYSWEEKDSKNSQNREKSPPPSKQLIKNHWFEQPLTSDQDQEEKRSCTEVKYRGSKTKVSLGKKDKKAIDSVVCRANTEMEMSNNDSIEDCGVYSASLSSFSSRVNSEVSSGCHLNSDISLQSKRRRLNKCCVMQKQKGTDIYSHIEKNICVRSREKVKYRHSIITLSQEKLKTANDTANEDNENDSSCQPSEGNEVQNLLVSSLQKRMKVHKDYSEAVVKTIANTAAELTTRCQDEWKNMVKEYEEKVRNSFEKVKTMLQESISQQNEFHKFLKKYSSESQKRYMNVKEETEVLSACTKEMCERLGEIISYKEDICSQNIQETEKLLNQEADQIIARERTRNRALVHEKVCHTLNKRK